MNNKIFPIFFLTSLLAATTKAEEAALEEVLVTSEYSTKLTEISKNREQIQKELIGSSQDLVRYTPDVGIADHGRHNKGFTLRGVEGNRVALSIDGIALPDSEENSLYNRYGNFNSSRLSIDPELIQRIEIGQGADSFNYGSGALGGVVNYRTLSYQDIIQPGRRSGVLLKNGYSSKNRQFTNTLGFALNENDIDVTALYSQRRGHELKSLTDGEDINGSARGIPDPSKHRYHAWLVKLGYRFNNLHRIAFETHGQKGSNYIDEKSYVLFGSQWREADDQHQRQSYRLSYEFTPNSTYLDTLKLHYDLQKTDIASVNYKGGRDWKTEQKRLDEIYDRRMKTKFNQVALELRSQPLVFLGAQHEFKLNGAFGKRRFENSNLDTLILSRGPTLIPGTIQHPVKTTQFHIGLFDHINWNEKLTSRLGFRYDSTRLKPQALNAKCNNCQDTIPPAKTFNGLSLLMGTDIFLTPSWLLSYDLTSGFRTPSASEMYFTFDKNSAGRWLANPKLQPEKSLNHALTLSGESNLGNLKVTVYHNRYKNFLHEQETITKEKNQFYDPSMCFYIGGDVCRQEREILSQQMVNIDKATINGISIQGELNLSEISPLPEGLVINGALGYSKGKLSNHSALLSIQPIKIVLGLGYDQPKGNWGLHGKWSYLGAKKAKDAMIYKNNFNYRTRNYSESHEPYPYLNQSATLFDLYGYVALSKNITLRGGIYNVFNRKYQTWDRLRGINIHSTTNTIDRDGKGLARFNEPGRNYVINLEIKL
ncbi:TonB-dependent hemoglobin/transferrin/lactoferrin family receptor [Pasteurella testudinis]|uniref:TonB-dependent hemoglobin/transferrin/lactoferrin family receptor n=1 Tax=Pasteurella testudinis TaxID=761 RepID=UPI0040594596